MEKWSSERAWEWVNSYDWQCGFNYVPSYARNSTEMWQDETYDESIIINELKIASKWGYNSIRLYLQFIVWEHNPDAYIRRIRRFFDIAEQFGMTVMPVLFDDCTSYKKEYLYLLDNPKAIEDVKDKLSIWKQPKLGE